MPIVAVTITSRPMGRRPLNCTRRRMQLVRIAALSLDARPSNQPVTLLVHKCQYHGSSHTGTIYTWLLHANYGKRSQLNALFREAQNCQVAYSDCVTGCRQERPELAYPVGFAGISLDKL